MSARSSLVSSSNFAVLTSDQSVFESVRRLLLPGHTTICTGSFERLAALLDRNHLQGAILDLDTTAQYHDVIQSIRRSHPHLPILGITRASDEDGVTRAIQAGADEVTTGPRAVPDIAVALNRILQKRRNTPSRQSGTEVVRKSSFCGLVGASEAMQRVYEAISRVALSPATVIIRGESGTGKELVAKAIVASGQRRGKPFVSVNCAALPETLIEAELFGHEKGSFTGAHVSRPGHIESAHGGTLFLDEISSLDLSLQSKLLRVLEEHTVQRIGSKVGHKIDFRLITATNDDLEDMVRTGRFREDLYYRIHVVPIYLPPLREREGDIPLLLDHFMKAYCAINNVPLKHVDLDVIEVLEEHSWPGNVREFENLVQRLVLMTESDMIAVKYLPQQILYSSTSRSQELLIPEDGIDFYEEMARIETAYLNAALRRSGGKKVAAAALLRLNRQQMKYLCRKYRM